VTAEGASGGVVRAAEPRDLDRVAAMWTSITQHHESLDPLFRMRPDADGELRELLRALMRDRDVGVFVFERKGDIGGICIVRIDHAPPILLETERAEITDLGVRPDLRRRGIGRLLLGEALAWVKMSGVKRVEVQVASANAEGQRFWRSQGFGDLMDVLHKRL
jgi:ribosomal protein S18 acetylase RimI-like enzyme